MKIRFSRRAESEADQKQLWWRTNRSAAPNLFDDELAAALDQICSTPTIGPIYPSGLGVVTRRVLMTRTTTMFTTPFTRARSSSSPCGAPLGNEAQPCE